MRCDIHALSEVQRLEALRILLVGSSKRTQHAAVELSRLGHSVLEAPDVADATHALMVQRFDAVVLSTGLPAADVSEFTAAVRELDQLSGDSVRTAILTTVADTISETQAAYNSETAYSSDIDGVVPESIDADALTLAIARLASAVRVDKSSSKIPDLAPELPILDVEELKAQVAYDSELLIELIELFLTERSRQSQEMAEALTAANYDALSRIAHTIKGSLGSLHADAARRTAQNVELAAREHDGAMCHDFLPHFEQQLDELEQHLLALKRSLSS